MSGKKDFFIFLVQYRSAFQTTSAAPHTPGDVFRYRIVHTLVFPLVFLFSHYSGTMLEPSARINESNSNRFIKGIQQEFQGLLGNNVNFGV